MARKFLILFFLSTGLFLSCKKDNYPGGGPGDNFDRKSMLINWADNIIMPAYDAFTKKTLTLQAVSRNFDKDPSQTKLDALRTAWLEAYLCWQRVAMYVYVKGDELNLRLMMNVYPTDVAKIEKYIQDGGYDLTKFSNLNKQGFPALNYMLYGLASDDAGILNFYTADAQSANYRKYVVDLAERIHDLASEVNNHWRSGFRDEFINNDGNSPNASVNRVAVDFVFYYERDLRAGKVGIPVGIFSDTLQLDRIEAYYRKNISKILLFEALNTAQDFFNGIHHGSSTNGISLDDYLDELNTMKNGADLSLLINDQFDAARAEIATLGDNFNNEIQNNLDGMLEAYTQLNLNVVLLKIDMMQALNINTDFRDIDVD